MYPECREKFWHTHTWVFDRVTNARLFRSRVCTNVNIFVASVRILSEMSHGIYLSDEFENDSLRGQRPRHTEVPYRGICWRAAAAAATELEVCRLSHREWYWMSSRERLRAALKELPISLPLPFVLLPLALHHPSSSALLFQLLPSLTVRAETCDVRTHLDAPTRPRSATLSLEDRRRIFTSARRHRRKS